MTAVIDRCRICDDPVLLPIIDLGRQALTGVFPRSRDEHVPTVPLELVKCAGQDGCGLVQLRHTADLDLMYGDGYGYRSGLNQSMVDHLRAKVERIRGLVDLGSDDLVLDIGSNDSTLLRAYPDTDVTLVGVDATGATFADYYPSHVQLIPEYFSAGVIAEHFGERKATVITSIAMFYDLPRPMDFMRDVHDVLADDGLWVTEQSYLPQMVANTAYDTICHEHLDYYSLRQIEWMAQRVGLKVIDAELNSVYGGSLSVTLAKTASSRPISEAAIGRLRDDEQRMRLDTMEPFTAFADRVANHRDALRDHLADARKRGRRTVGYGASTKGNVLLQYCELDEADLPCIAEVNADKFGCFTPGTSIPIVSESEARAHRPDEYLVLPWQYRTSIIRRERQFLADGGTLLFPLPEISSVVATQV